jgi:serine protease AprX
VTSDWNLANKVAKDAGIKLHKSYKKFSAFSADLTDAEASLLASALGVSSVEPTTLDDHALADQLSSFTGAEFVGDATVPPVTLHQVDDAINADGDGKGIDVALVDTGVAPVKGLDTAQAVAVGPDLSFDFQQGAPDGLDAYGHGTHLAGIIASRLSGDNEGIAKGSRVVDLKVGAFDGSVDVSQVIAAIDWATQHRNDPGFNIRVLNLSFGTDALQAEDIDPLSHAVESAWRNGIVVVVAAGNSGGALTNPAINPYVLVVGAADLNNTKTDLDDTVADFSSVGDAARGVDVLAPGVSIKSLRNPGSYIDQAFPTAVVDTNYFRGSGTSQAAAVASGAVADLLSKRPNLTPDQVKGVLRATARRLVLAPSNAQGAGMINLKAAIGAKLPKDGYAQTWPASTGLGSLELARGDSHVVSPDGIELTGEQDIFGAPWTPASWAPRSSAGQAWDGTTWNGNDWTDLGWTSDPSGVWSGSTWRSSTWRGTTWTGSTWRDDSWTGSTWRDQSWTGSTWRGSTWRGSTWRGSTWRSADDFGS